MLRGSEYYVNQLLKSSYGRIRRYLGKCGILRTYNIKDTIWEIIYIRFIVVWIVRFFYTNSSCGGYAAYRAIVAFGDADWVKNPHCYLTQNETTPFGSATFTEYIRHSNFVDRRELPDAFDADMAMIDLYDYHFQWLFQTNMVLTEHRLYFVQHQLNINRNLVNLYFKQIRTSRSAATRSAMGAVNYNNNDNNNNNTVQSAPPIAQSGQSAPGGAGRAASAGLGALQGTGKRGTMNITFRFDQNDEKKQE